MADQDLQAQETNAESPEARIAELEAQLAAARQEAAANWDKYLRQVADSDNFRKRQERLSAERIKSQKKELLQKLLAVMDNLDRALAYQDTLDQQGLQQGLRMVQWQLGELLRSEGLTPVATVGESFDPRVHEAVESVATDSHPEGTVIEEVQKGYMLGNEMLRPARVKVSSGSQHG